MQKRSGAALKFLLFSLSFSLCLAAIAAGGLIGLIPNRAEKLFGQPHSGLESIDQLYLATKLLISEKHLTSPTDPNGNIQDFQVNLGEATGLVIQRLHAAGLISDPEAFRSYLQYSGLDTGIQAGSYNLSAAMSPVEIAIALQDATPSRVNFNILPGWRLEEIARALPTSGLTIAPEAFLETARKPAQGYLFSTSLPPYASLEGFFLPGSYTFERTTDKDSFIHTFLTAFESNLRPDLLQGITKQNLDIYRAVTLASIIQRESVLDEEMPLIASVFYNRLQVGIKLDADSTVQYALGYNPEQDSWWTNPLSTPDLSFDSAYNTYLYVGLPPGPIANPSPQALNAVAFPAQSPYIYFRAACDGSGRHRFAETFEEHLQNACP